MSTSNKSTATMDAAIKDAAVQDAGTQDFGITSTSTMETPTTTDTPVKKSRKPRWKGAKRGKRGKKGKKDENKGKKDEKRVSFTEPVHTFFPSPPISCSSSSSSSTNDANAPPSVFTSTSQSVSTERGALLTQPIASRQSTGVANSMDETFAMYANMKIGGTPPTSPQSAASGTTIVTTPVMKTPKAAIDVLQGLFSFLAEIGRTPAVEAPKELDDFFRRKVVGLSNEHGIVWDGLCKSIESHGVSTDAFKKTPFALATTPYLMVSVTSSLLAIHAAEQNKAKEIRPTADAAAATDAAITLIPAPERIPGSPFGPTDHVSSPPYPSSSSSDTSPTIRTPKAYMRIHDGIYVGLQYNGVDITGFFVDIKDIKFDGSNEIHWSGKLWLKLRVVRESPKLGGGGADGLTAEGYPAHPIAQWRGRLEPPVGLGFAVGGVGGGSPSLAGAGVTEPFHNQVPAFQKSPLAFDNQPGAPKAIKIGDDHYTQIREGVLAGYLIGRKGGFTFGGLDWVKEVLVVPAGVESKGGRA